MIKPLIILVNTITVFLFGLFFGDTPVTINGNFPKTATANTEFIVDITINKGSVGGFAKFQLEVPQGVIVKELESKSGNFSFATNIAKIIWTATPNEDAFTIKMVLSADADGVKTIGAKYSYVNNNAKEVVEMTPVEITIGNVTTTNPVATNDHTPAAPETTTPSSQIVTPVTSTTSEITNPSEPLSNVNCMRTLTKGATDNETNVEVKIKKPGIKGFAKYQEMLPDGYTAKSNQTNGSSFSVSDGKAKFVWVAVPLEDELIVTYILEKTNPAVANNPTLNGEFSYLEAEQTKKVKAQTVLASQPIATNTDAQKIIEPPVAAVTETPTANTTPTNVTEPPLTNNVTKTETSITKKDGAVLYCVQVGAFKNAIESTVLAKKFNINETIKSEMAEGFSKFMVGNFTEYKQARSHREAIKQKGCNSAFVAAYNGPKRITVQEALMITSQKWFK